MKRNLKVALFLQIIVSGVPLMADLFIPEFAVRLGATKFQIGIMGTAFAFSMFVSAGFFGRLSDIIGRKKVLLVGFFLTGIFYASAYFSKTFESLFIVRVLQGIAIGVYPGALAAYVHENKGTMNEYAMWGALGIASFLAFSGIIAGVTNIRWIFIFVGVLYIVSLAFALSLKEEFGEPQKLPIFPRRVIARNFHVYIAIFLTFAGITMTWTYWVLYLEKLRMSPYLIGVITGINPLFEFLTLMFVAKKIKFGSTKFGIFVLAITYPLFVFAKSALLVLILQALSGFGWAFMFAGGLNDVVNNETEKGTATGLFQSSVSLGNIAGPSIAGIVSLFFGNVTAVFAFAGLVIFSGFLSILIREYILKNKICG